MPAYPASNQAKLLYENQQAILWANELVPVGALSVAVQLRRERGQFYPNGCSIEVYFSASPGVFAVDVLVADTDIASHYTLAGTINTVNAGFVARLELPNLFAKYILLRNTTAPNAATVAVTGQITR